MVLLESQVPINLEVLDPSGRPISGVAATLCHLDANSAILGIEPGAQAPCLYWGARVRFWVESGANGYEVTGAIVAQDVRPGRFGSAADSEEGSGEVRIRLFECHARVQQRDSPRRRAKLTVRFAAITAPADEDSLEADTIDVQPNENEWRTGVTIDVAPGGVRLRTGRMESAPDHVLVELELPAFESQQRSRPARPLRLRGKVLRHEPASRRADAAVLAIKFRNLSVEDGLALTHFVLD